MKQDFPVRGKLFYCHTRNCPCAGKFIENIEQDCPGSKIRPGGYYCGYRYESTFITGLSIAFHRMVIPLLRISNGRHCLEQSFYISGKASRFTGNTSEAAHR
jgi:hypothetical protein